MSKKNTGSSRQLLRTMQRHNRRYSGYTNRKGVEVSPREERIKRNHMNMASVEERIHGAMILRCLGINPTGRYIIV